MTDDLKKEYIKSIISVVEEDKKSVLLYVAFDLAIVSLTLSGKIVDNEFAKSSVVAPGLLFLLISATYFFNHYRKIHLSTFAIIDQILTLDTDRARAIPTETWVKHSEGYRIGYMIRAVGVGTLLFAYFVNL